MLQPIITTSLNMFKVTFPNTNYEHTNKICETIDFSTIGTLNGTLNNYEEQIIKLIINNNKITRKELANTLNVSVRTIQRIINKSDRISYIGIGKSGHWQIKNHQN